MKPYTTYVWWVRGKRFAEYAQWSIAAVKRVDRHYGERKFILCTDKADPEWKDVVEMAAPMGSGVNVYALSSSQPTISARLDAQIEVLMHETHGDRVLFLDADAFMRKPFPWEPEADLYLTWRDQVNGNREQAKFIPYNGGVVGVTVNPATIEAFIWLRARIRQMNADNQRWNGDQLALADLAGAPRGESWETRIRWSLDDDGTPLRIRALPCEIYNYSPDGIEDVSEKVIVHLKGERKDLIKHYAEVA